MSPSTRSKPASPSSRATGDETDKVGPHDAIEVELEMSRQRTIGWTVLGVVVGLLLVLRLGTVGVWGGYVLIAIGLYRGFQLVQSYRNPAGRIVVTPKEVALPRGVHMTNPLVVSPSEITAVYFLRRSVPWNRHAPVLVVELGERALAFPRDWFSTEADQRRIVHALLAHCPVLGEAAAKARVSATEAAG
jgi:hypothetical protein